MNPLLGSPYGPWQPGDVVIDVDCEQTWLRSLSGTWIGRDGREHDDDEYVTRCRFLLVVRDSRVIGDGDVSYLGPTGSLDRGVWNAEMQRRFGRDADV